jgi:hypothetical protein
VDFLSEKLDLAVQYGAQAFFVPQVQARGSSASGGGGIEIGCPADGRARPVRALADLTCGWSRRRHRPTRSGRHTSLSALQQVLSNQPRGEPGRPVLLDSPAADDHPALSCPDSCAIPDCRPTHMVTIVSGSPELVLLAARSLDVRRCLLLYTPDKIRAGPDGADADGPGVVGGRWTVCVPARLRTTRRLEQEIPAAIA